MTSRIALVSLVALTLSACGDDEVSLTGVTGDTVEIPDNAAQALETYADIALASYTDSLTTAEAMDTALQALVDSPSEATLTAAKDAWKDAREPYLQTEVYRFYGGPIDDDDGPEGLLNAWPMDENYVDYVADGAEEGKINDTDFAITGEAIEGLNEEGGDANISTGYHAIEFLLWGQDVSETGPGERPFTDYVDGGTAANQGRRGEYLLTVSSLLVGHLEDLVGAWATDDASNYRAEFLAMDAKISLGLVTSGAAILAGFETGGERLLAALDGNSQEDEHSCFSDNTHRDMIQDILGVQNVWSGSYDGLTAATTVSGTGLGEVYAVEDSVIAGDITDEIADALALAKTMEAGGRFDQMIAEGNTEGNALVQAVIDSLVRLEERLEDDAMELFDLTKIDPEA